MENINLNNKESVLKLKKNIDKVFESKLEKIDLKENLSKINSMDFNKTKTLFEYFFTKLYESKNGRSTIKKYCETIKNSKILKEAYKLVEDIKNHKDISYPEEYISEVINIFEALDKKSLKKENNRLCGILKEGLSKISVTNDDFKDFLNEYDSDKLNESISFIMVNEKKLSNLDDFSKSKNVLKEYITNNKSQENVCESATIDDLNDIISEDFSNFEKKVIQDVVLNSLNGNNKRDLFESYKNECISIINENLSNGSVEERSNLETILEKLRNKQYNDNTVNEDLLKLSELKETLLC